MHRFYVPPESCQDSTITLEDREAHHGLHVLRVRPRERATVLDGAGTEYLCEVQEIDRHTIRLAVVQKHTLPRLPYELTLVQAVPKGKALDTIIQKATELGVARIVPLLSERVVANVQVEDVTDKTAKWQLIAIEALKQCGNPWLPRLDPPVSPKAFLARAESFDLSLLASLQPGYKHPREWLQAYVAERKRLPSSVSVWVGPEGDFTPAEMSAAKAAGALPITLGRLVLRSDTAAIYCLSILNYELQAPPAVAVS
jgi:16S rRNA (uracil1498-N3)-methyltransferase